jgi:iron-sulfur cluster assembly accessory protein
MTEVASSTWDRMTATSTGTTGVASEKPEAKPAVSITLTESASKMLKQYQARQGSTEMPLRVFVYPGGGCGCGSGGGGLSYGMKFEQAPEEGDVVLDSEGGLKVIVDENSAQYLDGAKIDFEDGGLGGAGFRIIAPKLGGGGGGGCCGGGGGGGGGHGHGHGGGRSGGGCGCGGH